MENSTDNNVWYIDSGASFHMTTSKKNLRHLKKMDMQFQIELGDYGMYAARGVGIVSFQRESGNLLHLKDFLDVPGLR